MDTMALVNSLETELLYNERWAHGSGPTPWPSSVCLVYNMPGEQNIDINKNQ